MSPMYDSPALSRRTLTGSLSYPVTRKPARANSSTSGNPTYPIPMTTTRAVLFSIFLTRSMSLTDPPCSCHGPAVAPLGLDGPLQNRDRPLAEQKLRFLRTLELDESFD